MAEKKFIKRIQELEKLTPSENKIADFFSRNYDELVFENLSSISVKASVSKPTVLRFITKLGFERFADFNKALRDELTFTHDSLHIRYSLKKKLLQDSEEDTIAYTFTNTIKNLESTYKHMDRQAFMAIAKGIARTKGALYLAGQRSSHALAYMFHNMIQRVMPDSFLIDTGCSSEPDSFLRVRGADILFAVFRRPYGSQTLRIIDYFRQQEARVMLLTDSEMNPAADKADHQLVVNTEGVSVFTSSTSILAVLEALNIAVLGFCEDDVSARIEKMESLYKHFNTFCS